jgi:hypothetical protein
VWAIERRVSRLWLAQSQVRSSVDDGRTLHGLGRKNYTREELDRGRAAIREQLAVYEKLTKATAAEQAANSGTEAFESLFFNNLTLVLDRYFVHRLRTVAPVTGSGSRRATSSASPRRSSPR